jgi:hypothetical protein
MLEALHANTATYSVMPSAVTAPQRVFLVCSGVMLFWSSEDNYEGGYEVSGEKHRKSKHSAADSAVDKLQEYRRSKGKLDLLDKAIDKAQEAGLVNKAFDTIKRRFIGR